MPLFRKKPVVIEAVLYRAGEQPGELAADVVAGRVRYPEDGTMLIDTLEGSMIARPGDWIIRGVKGELYPCKPGIFAATYETAETAEKPCEATWMGEHHCDLDAGHDGQHVADNAAEGGATLVWGDGSLLRFLAQRLIRRCDVSLENIEAVAEDFRQETRYLAPGKSIPPEMDSDSYRTEQRAAWNKWLGERQQEDLAYARAALAAGAGRPAARPSAEKEK